MSIEFVLKKHMDEIIDNAYYDLAEERRKYYKWYKLKIINNKVKSKLGDYNQATHVVRLLNINKNDEANNIVTLIHEVSHHIDWCQRKKSDHQKEFYVIFKKLLYSALDLKKVTPEEIINMKRNGQGHSKVIKMMNEYSNQNPHIHINSKYDSIIQINNAFAIRNELKAYDYYWNSLTKTWDKEINGISEGDNELSKLKELGVIEKDINIIDVNKMHLQDKSIKDKSFDISVKGDTYHFRYELKCLGFKWNSKIKRWDRSAASEEEYRIISDAVKQIDQNLTVLKEE